MGLDPFYKKYLDADGLPIVASAEVPDAALYRAREIIDEVLANRSDLRGTMARFRVRVAVMAESEVLTDLPEFSDLSEHPSGMSWDERTRGGGVGPTYSRPTVAIAEQNLLCSESDVFPYEDLFVHELAHGVLTMGIQGQPGGTEFRRRLVVAYQNALAAGLWEHTYAAENPDEYWAEGVQAWFGLNDPPGPIHNEINTRADLESYDPALAGLIREALGEVEVSASCHETRDISHDKFIQGRVLGPEGTPLGGLSLWAWQGNVISSGFGRTRLDGTFHIWVPDGTFTLDIYTEDNCVGWYDGGNSITTSRTSAAKLTVDGENLRGIEIRLPRPPSELRRIRC